jgi:hypothetical protein
MYVIRSYQKLVFILKTQCVLWYFYFKIISKVTHHGTTLFPYKCHILVEAASGHKVSHKMSKTAIAVVLTAYAALFAFTGK